MEWKTLSVSAGPRDNPVNVQLNGILPADKLTPKMARRAARVAFGHCDQVTVRDHEYGHGYRIYDRSARKLRKEQVR